LFLTHEHSDHISGAGALTKKHGTPVYGTRGTREALRRHISPDVDWRTIQQEDESVVGDLTVESFATPHDAAESVAYVVRCGSKKLGHITDLGKVTPRIVEKLQDCDTLLVESNHDERMLENGFYPWPLKQRIQSDVGHLSNTACADLLAQVKHENGSADASQRIEQPSGTRNGLRPPDTGRPPRDPLPRPPETPLRSHPC
jgi:phosphoribosyl 1,2-cyclic phosphodiesterase